MGRFENKSGRIQKLFSFLEIPPHPPTQGKETKEGNSVFHTEGWVSPLMQFQECLSRVLHSEEEGRDYHQSIFQCKKFSDVRE